MISGKPVVTEVADIATFTVYTVKCIIALFNFGIMCLKTAM